MKTLMALLEKQHHLKLIREHALVWLVPTVVLGLIGTLFALVRPSVWVASQGLIVRDEVVGELGSHGRFISSDERKAAQEMILQVARNREVVIGALKEVVPQKKQNRGFPNESLISQWRDSIAVVAPKGSEFGESEVIYLQVKGKKPDQAIQNTRAVSHSLEKYLTFVRGKRTDSVIEELSGKLKVAVKNRSLATAQLEQMERELGPDLGELRTLNRSGSGESNLRTSLGQIKSDLRNAKSQRTKQVEQLEFLRAAVKQPEAIVATPNGVLESQAALKRLKDGLVDSQLRLADLLGKMNSEHPEVRAAQVAVLEIHSKLRTELKTAIIGAEAELRVNQAIINNYDRQLRDVGNRLSSLASMRARYENLVADVNHRNAQVKENQKALAEARASREVADISSLVTFVGEPESSDSPIGPGRLVLMGISWVGGALAGIGLLLLIAPGQHSSDGRGRRQADRINSGETAGRRATDVATDESESRSDGPPQRRQADAAGTGDPPNTSGPVADNGVYQFSTEDDSLTDPQKS